MLVKKWVTFEQEIDVEISGEDAVQAILDERTEEWKPVPALKLAVNNFATFLLKVPDTVIAELGAPAREIIADFFEAQAKRFRPEVKP